MERGAGRRLDGSFSARGAGHLSWRMVLLVAAGLLVALAPGVAQASWIATGSFHYVDREFDENGFTGFEPLRPIRSADIEVVDPDAPKRSQILATGATAADGSYSIFVADNKVRSILVRVISRSGSTPDLNIDVRTDTTNKITHYAVATATISSHSPSVSVDFGAEVAAIGQGGEAFNIYDQMLLGADYIAFLDGARPPADKHLATVWDANNGVAAASYSVPLMMILLRATAGYDDTVILHEMAHYVVNQYSASNSPGGFHTFALCDEDIRLAFDEGFATYWGNSVRRHDGLPNSHVYLRSNGGPGPGNVVRTADLETDTQYLCSGSNSEVNTFEFLWDLVDGPSTTDATPGVDDTPIDTLDLDDASIWSVMVNHIPTATSISLEDFWDGWFLLGGQPGTLPGLLDVADGLSIEFHEDLDEVNDAAAEAVAFAVNGIPVHATFFRDPDLDGAGSGGIDVDMYSFMTMAGGVYVIETLALQGDANTFLRVRDSDGTTLLAFNDNRASGDLSSRIDFTAPRTDRFFVEVSRSTSFAAYGEYDLSISTTAAVDNDGDGFDSFSDCNDLDPAINPGMAEVCDGIDQNCNGQIDEGFDLDVDGYTVCQGDCDDTEPSVNPGAPDIPGNGIDDDCNGIIDDGVAVDVITIVQAVWRSNFETLLVEATSSDQPVALLTVVGFGDMAFDPTIGRYTFTAVVPDKPDFVAVVSDHLGSATVAVVERIPGGGGGGDGDTNVSCRGDEIPQGAGVCHTLDRNF
ncbi:MAG: MopE-related protein [Acidobacteriota bacterium]